VTVWILAVLVLAWLAGLGYRQGVIRVAFSFAGILLGALLAPRLAPLVEPVLPLVGVKNPLLVRLLAPCIVFLAVLALFKIAGLIVHQKVEVYYKYKGVELELSLWERLSQRLGLCLALFNGTAYLVLAASAVYPVSYATYQLATPGADPKTIRILNQLGKDLETTGMARVARSVDMAPAAYYDIADVAGLVYHNPLLQARLSRYPAFLGLAERPQFQDIAGDVHFTELQMKQAPIMELLYYPKMQAILKDPGLLNSIRDALVPDLPDLTNYLATGRSPKYDSEKILGRWNFDPAGTILLLRKARPNITSLDMKKWKLWMTANYTKASFVATPEQQALLKDFPHSRSSAEGEPPVGEPALQGRWKSAGDKYDLTFNADGKTEELTAEVQGDHLTLGGAGIDLAFARED
jgi:hypothetical protein